MFALEPSRGARTLVGTSSTCGVQLSDPHVSRRHLALDPLGSELALSDLRSTNGTLVNGVHIIEGRLVGGETVRIGATTLRLDFLGMGEIVPVAPDRSFGRLVGISVEMRRVFALASRLAESHVATLIEGDTGTGKEVLAEALHAQGPRFKGPFVVLDTSSAHEKLLEVTLFGCEANVVPGVAAAQAGLFEMANGGTLLIDEPAELHLDLQRKLTRVLERGTVQRLGSPHAIPVDVRIVSTSRVDLDKAVDEQRLREELFFRLVTARIELPPLRKRTGDIAFLTHHFWSELGGTHDPSPALIARFEGHSWPGNVRELQNAIARHLVTGEALGARRDIRTSTAAGANERNVLDEILAEDLPMPKARQALLAEFERGYVERMLAKNDGNVTRAAAASGIAHRYFQSLKARYTKR